MEAVPARDAREYLAVETAHAVVVSGDRRN